MPRELRAQPCGHAAREFHLEYAVLPHDRHQVAVAVEVVVFAGVGGAEALVDGHPQIAVAVDGVRLPVVDDERDRPQGLPVVIAEEFLGVRRMNAVADLFLDMPVEVALVDEIRITSYNVCYTKLLRAAAPAPQPGCSASHRRP